MRQLFTLLLAVMLCSNITVAQAQQSLHQRSFPTELPTEDGNIEWQRDIYREIDLTADENAGLYCPQDPTENQRGLFTKIFQLAIEKKIPLYGYNIDGNEIFKEDTKADIKDILANHHIYYEEEDTVIVVDDDEIPSTSVMAYYIKEKAYFDKLNSAFRIKVEAICPILIEEDDFSEGKTKYPLFWVEYKDIEPYLKDMTLIPDYKNCAKVMSMADYFTRNMYKGEIYKVSNVLGKTLHQMVDSEEDFKNIQQRIENEIKEIRKKTYNTYFSPSHK